MQSTNLCRSIFSLLARVHQLTGGTIPLIGRIKAHLASACTEAGAASIKELVGCRAKEWAEKPVEGGGFVRH